MEREREKNEEGKERETPLIARKKPVTGSKKREQKKAYIQKNRKRRHKAVRKTEGRQPREA